MHGPRAPEVSQGLHQPSLALLHDARQPQVGRELRGVLQAQARAREAQTLGFKKLILPESNKKGLEKLLGIRVVGVKNLDEAIAELF